jgi:hypothetical protein
LGFRRGPFIVVLLTHAFDQPVGFSRNMPAAVSR